MGRNPEANNEQREQTCSKLLRAGRELFATDGFERTTVAAIAKRAGCSKGLLYHYFPTKTALVEAILDEWRGQVASVAAGAAGGTPRERLGNFARGMAAFVDANPDDYRLNLRALSDPNLRRIAGEMTYPEMGEEHAWAAAFAHLGTPLDVELRFFQTSLIGIFTHRVMSPVPTPVAELVEHLIELTLERPWTST